MTEWLWTETPTAAHLASPAAPTNHRLSRELCALIGHRMYFCSNSQENKLCQGETRQVLLCPFDELFVETLSLIQNDAIR